MRLFHLVILAATLFMGTTGCKAAFAVSDVLLPSDTGSSSPPNLGLTPQQTPAPSAAPVSSSDPGSSILPAPTDAPLPYTPVPSASVPRAPSPITTFNTMPTHVMQMPVSTIPSATTPSTAPGQNLSIILSDKSIWGVNDIAAISQRLGIPKDKVTSQCAMALAGMMTTSATPAVFDTSTNLQTSVRYPGQLKNVMLRVQALCTSQALPPDSGFIVAYGNRYSQPLTGLSCQPPPNAPPPQTLTVLYLGTGTAECHFR